VQIKNPNFKNTLLERLSRDKEVKIKMSYNESMDIPEEKKCELIIRSGLMHKDVVLFSEEGISVENIRNLQKGLKDQQKENVTRASEIGLLNGFSLKEVDALKNAPVRVLLYKDNKYVEHPLDKKLNPNLPSNTSSLPNIGSNTR
jgi:hypothetical protein